MVRVHDRRGRGKHRHEHRERASRVFVLRERGLHTTAVTARLEHLPRTAPVTVLREP